MGNTDNTTLVLQDYNAWADQQRTYNDQVSADLTQMGNNIDTYNHGIASDPHDIGVLRENTATDQQALDAWDTSGRALGSATDTFMTNTASLDFGTDSESRRLSSLLAQEIKIYSIDMSNAQQHFVDYNHDISGYLAPDDPEYWDDSLRVAALDAKAKALSSVEDGDTALSNITTTAHLIEERQ
jgi:hypothetical protein